MVSKIAVIGSMLCAFAMMLLWVESYFASTYQCTIRSNDRIVVLQSFLGRLAVSVVSESSIMKEDAQFGSQGSGFSVIQGIPAELELDQILSLLFRSHRLESTRFSTTLYAPHWWGVALFGLLPAVTGLRRLRQVRLRRKRGGQMTDRPGLFVLVSTTVFVAVLGACNGHRGGSMDNSSAEPLPQTAGDREGHEILDGSDGGPELKSLIIPFLLAEGAELAPLAVQDQARRLDNRLIFVSQGGAETLAIDDSGLRDRYTADLVDVKIIDGKYALLKYSCVHRLYTHFSVLVDGVNGTVVYVRPLVEVVNRSDGPEGCAAVHAGRFSKGRGGCL